MKFPVQSLSIGMLHSSMVFPDPSLPEWANTVAIRLLDQGISKTRIKEIIEAMERDRRKKTRRLLGNPNIHPCDVKLAEIINSLLEKYGN